MSSRIMSLSTCYSNNDRLPMHAIQSFRRPSLQLHLDYIMRLRFDLS